MHRPLPLLAALATLAALLAATAARACSVCGCGDPLLLASDPSAITGLLRLQADAEIVRVDAGTDGRPSFTDQLTQWSYRLNAVYRPLGALTLTATLPLVHKTIRTVGGGTEVTASSLTGLGDLEVGARLALLTSVDMGAQRVQELAISAGSSLPTGSHDARDADGALIDPHGQLGTGGFGPFAGVHYRLERGEWTAFASLTYRLRTEAGFSDGSRYRFGDALLWSVHGQRRIWPALVADLGVDGRYAVADRSVEAGGTVTPSVRNTGGTVLSAAPGLYLRPLPGLWLFVRAQVPFLKQLRGEQDVKPSATAGVQLEVM